MHYVDKLTRTTNSCMHAHAHSQAEEDNSKLHAGEYTRTVLTCTPHIVNHHLAEEDDDLQMDDYEESRHNEEVRIGV